MGHRPSPVIYATSRNVDARRRSCSAARHFSRRPNALAQPAALPGAYQQTNITWSEQLHRIFEFDLDAPVTLELIGTRIHPEDLSIFMDQVERSRWNERRRGIRIPAADAGQLGQILALDRAQRPRRARSTGVHRRDSGHDRAPALGRGTQQGPIGARARGQGHEPRSIDGVDRARSQPASVGHHHQRQHLSANAGRRSTKCRRCARNRAAHDSRWQPCV